MNASSYNRINLKERAVRVETRNGSNLLGQANSRLKLSKQELAFQRVKFSETLKSLTGSADRNPQQLALRLEHGLRDLKKLQSAIGAGQKKIADLKSNRDSLFKQWLESKKLGDRLIQKLEHLAKAKLRAEEGSELEELQASAHAGNLISQTRSEATALDVTLLDVGSVGTVVSAASPLNTAPGEEQGKAESPGPRSESSADSSQALNLRKYEHGSNLTKLEVEYLTKNGDRLALEIHQSGNSALVVRIFPDDRRRAKQLQLEGERLRQALIKTGVKVQKLRVLGT